MLTFLPGSAIFALAGLVGVRLLWRAMHDRSLVRGLLVARPSQARVGPPLILVGGVRQAEALVRKLSADAHATHEPIAIFTRDRNGVGKLVHGVPVHELREDLAAQARSLHPSQDERPSLLFLDDPVNVAEAHTQPLELGGGMQALEGLE